MEARKGKVGAREEQEGRRRGGREGGGRAPGERWKEAGGEQGEDGAEAVR